MNMEQLIEDFTISKNTLLNKSMLFIEEYQEYKINILRDVRLLKDMMKDKVMKSNALDE